VSGILAGGQSAQSRPYVLLLPSLEVVRQRNGLRDGPHRLTDAMVATIYEMMLPWRDQSGVPVLDSSMWTLDETADRLQETVRTPGPE
jgi:hypothetical protein